MTFLSQKISLISIVESEFVFSEGPAKTRFEPVSVSFIADGLSFDFEDFASPEKEKFPGVILEVSEVPDSGDGEGGSGIEPEAAPVPGEFEGVEDVIQNAEGDEGFVWGYDERYRKCRDT